MPAFRSGNLRINKSAVFRNSGTIIRIAPALSRLILVDTQTDNKRFALILLIGDPRQIHLRHPACLICTIIIKIDRYFPADIILKLMFDE